jgi:two-component system sensor histidine kinase TctE
VPAELQGLVGGFNGLLGRLENAVVGMGRVTAHATHHKRPPQANIRTHQAVVGEQGTDTPQGQASMNDLEAAVDRLRRLLTQLIALARAEESAVGQSQLKPFRLDEVAAEAARAVAPSAISQGIELHFDAADTPFRVRGNPVLASEIVTNLLENAIQYNQPGGNVTLRLSDGDGVVRLHVDDDGPGIPAKDRERVFQRFHRLARDERHLGSGLGLPIVKTLAQSMNASIELAEGPSGRGLSVGVVFQRAA